MGTSSQSVVRCQSKLLEVIYRDLPGIAELCDFFSNSVTLWSKALAWGWLPEEHAMSWNLEPYLQCRYMSDRNIREMANVFPVAMR